MPDEILSYFSSLNWSLVSKGFGNISKSLAENWASGNGKGINIRFLLIKFNNFCNNSLKDFSYCKLHLLYAYQPKGKKEEVTEKEEVVEFTEKKIQSA